MQLSRGNRRGRNFCVRVSDADLAAFLECGFGSTGPKALGPWLLHMATVGRRPALALPGRSKRQKAGAFRRSTRHCPNQVLAMPRRAMPGLVGTAFARPRLILDLCGGSGAWSRPYEAAGYSVELVEKTHLKDVKSYMPPRNVHGILAAPPCTEFSAAKTSKQRDYASGLECVVACLRIIALAKPAWWCLENPGSGHLRRWLGIPKDVFQPCDFGDPWTKSTALWGDFAIPQRSHCRARRGMPGNTSASRAITPTGFAQAFFAANP